MCQELGIDIDTSKSHNALYDVEKNVELFEKIKYLLK
jgi:DNA polymerase III epsilon subunit-like protein